MVLKGLVRDATNPYNVSVYVPQLKDTLTAEVCSLPHCEMNLSSGDVVFLSFENNYIDTPIIIGTLHSKNDVAPKKPDMSFSDIEVQIKARLPEDTEIGSIKAEEIKNLSGIKSNIQSQLNTLETTINDNNKDLSNRISTIEKEIEEPFVLTNKSYGETLPSNPELGQLFFLIEKDTQ